MMAETGASEQQGVGGAGSEVGGVVPEYGMPAEPGIELVRLDMTEVPVGGQSLNGCSLGDERTTPTAGVGSCA